MYVYYVVRYKECNHLVIKNPVLSQKFLQVEARLHNVFRRVRGRVYIYDVVRCKECVHLVIKKNVFGPK